MWSISASSKAFSFARRCLSNCQIKTVVAIIATKASVRTIGIMREERVKREGEAMAAREIKSTTRNIAGERVGFLVRL